MQPRNSGKGYRIGIPKHHFNQILGRTQYVLGKVVDDVEKFLCGSERCKLPEIYLFPKRFTSADNCFDLLTDRMTIYSLVGNHGLDFPDKEEEHLKKLNPNDAVVCDLDDLHRITLPDEIGKGLEDKVELVPSKGLNFLYLKNHKA